MNLAENPLSKINKKSLQDITNEEAKTLYCDLLKVIFTNTANNLDKLLEKKVNLNGKDHVEVHIIYRDIEVLCNGVIPDQIALDYKNSLNITDEKLNQLINKANKEIKENNGKET